ncbi:PPOX class F420-dependent oxidoreductase [Streptomyces durbertensis]|uniref:PPOX class F420-dependent oxidoreductase n=1 Tax=Streptomyces durbertensis TaxID=2448886 RepID=A0ABR6ED53_9ACTN|nr:PPOX class F420-dependent oxidoreductase [Streptomyces durbertensis]MBB1243251.1 PPOX class F420-dependent oxidoreductase [Streptomyces durbertensis]
MIPVEISDARYVSLTTYRKDGTPVATPVWAVEDGGELLVWTRDDAWKVKRLRRDKRVRVEVCDVRGRVAEGAPSAEGTGRVMETAELPRVRRALARKYGWQFRLTDLGGALVRFGRRPHVGLAVSL